MKDRQSKTADPLIDEVRQTRRSLVQQHGGLRGWAEHLRKLQEEHREKVVSPKKQAAP